MSINKHIKAAARYLLALGLCCTTALAAAQSSPEGLWRTIDDETGEVKSLVRIAAQAGQLVGVVESIISPESQDARCELCSDERQDQLILGMEIIRAVPLEADNEVWSGGNILDPSKGKVYKLSLSLNEDGSELKVRGYIGFSLLGRTQIWQRVE